MRLPGRGMRPGNFVCSDNREIGRVARRIESISAVAGSNQSLTLTPQVLLGIKID